MRAAVAILLLVIAARFAAADAFLDSLDTDDPRALSSAVTRIERASLDELGPGAADALFAAAQACEDRLQEPARALGLYERIARELPHARVVTAAERRAERLHRGMGVRGEHAREATELAQLIAAADTLPSEEIRRRADVLATAAWPGAVDAALWLAEYLRRVKRFDEAQPRFSIVVERWPGTPQALTALRGAAGNAIDNGDWDLADALTLQLPTLDASDRIMRDDLRAAIRSGRMQSGLYLASWIALVLVVIGIAASLAEAVLRGGRRMPSLRPPLEVWFIAPIGALVVAITLGTKSTVSSVVIAIVVMGTILAWCSGTTLDLLRTRDRAVRARAIAHALGALVAVLALGYIEIVREELMPMLIETIRSGPE